MIKEIYGEETPVEDFYLEDHWIGPGGQTHYKEIVPIKAYPIN